MADAQGAGSVKWQAVALLGDKDRVGRARSEARARIDHTVATDETHREPRAGPRLTQAPPIGRFRAAPAL
jgi:hypothetical protein